MRTKQERKKGKVEQEDEYRMKIRKAIGTEVTTGAVRCALF